MPGLWLDPASLTAPPNCFTDATEVAAYTASYVLWALSGRKYDGLYTATERYVPPCRGACGCRRWSGLDLSTAADGSTWISGACGCRWYREGLALRGYPVRSIGSLSHGPSGALIDPSEYEVTDRRVVRTIPGVSTWSPCEELLVTYTYGAVPPRAGTNAAWIFANELLKGADGDETCRLPKEVTSFSREGITVTLPDPQTFLAQGRTGIPEVDLFIMAANPAKAHMKPRILTPDLPRRQRRSS